MYSPAARMTGAVPCGSPGVVSRLLMSYAARSTAGSASPLGSMTLLLLAPVVAAALAGRPARVQLLDHDAIVVVLTLLAAAADEEAEGSGCECPTSCPLLSST